MIPGITEQCSFEKCHPLHRESKSYIITCVSCKHLETLLFSILGQCDLGPTDAQYCSDVIWPTQEHIKSMIMFHLSWNMYKLSTYRTASAVFSLNHVPLVLSGKTLQKWLTWKYQSPIKVLTSLFEHAASVREWLTFDSTLPGWSKMALKETEFFLKKKQTTSPWWKKFPNCQ